MRRLLSVFFLLLLIPPSIFAQNAGELVSGKKGMVVSASAEASRVGVEILRAGGNAVDAAVAVGFALAVTYPTAGNLGGGCYIVVRMADGRAAAIDARETAPAAAFRDMYLDEKGEVVPERSLYGPLAAGVPGSVHGLLTALDAFGSFPREIVLTPAVQLATDGFPLHPRQARHFRIMREEFARFPQTLETYTRDGVHYKKGERWRQPELAQTLSRIRESGVEGFYKGNTADLIVKAMKADGGLITLEDLASYQSIVRKPLRGQYRGHEVLSMPPSSSGGVALLQMLAMLESRKLHIPSADHVATTHFMIESMRRVFADRAVFLGDPAFYDIPLARLLSREYCDSLYASIDPARATPSSDIRRTMLPPREGEQTTHYSIVDRWGNAVSVTTTLNSSFGSMYVVPGTGFLLNNEMDDFSARPGVPNQFGLLGGEANSIQPGKRMLSSMTPAIVMRDGKVVMITGSPGGSTIITTVLHSICNMIDAGMRVDNVVAARRFHHQWYPDIVRYERGALNELTLEALRAMGHVFREVSAIGRCDAIIAYPGKSVVEGCSDPRGYGAAVAE